MIRHRIKKVAGLASDLGNVAPHLARTNSAAAITPRMKFLRWNAQAQEWQ